MFTNTGFLNEDETDLIDMSVPLRINSCGVYRLVSLPYMSTARPWGRDDYQLLYISSGRAFFDIQGKKVEVPSGNMVLYRPYEKQQYIYYREDKSEVYWIHFTGNQVEQLLAQIGFERIDNIYILETGIYSDYQEIFLQMIRELQMTRPCFEEILPLYFQQLLVIINRKKQEGKRAQNRIRKEIEEAIIYFNENFAQNIEIEAYAQSQHMSICWFIRVFKQSMGVPPLQYIRSIRIRRAKELLEGSDYTIGEISSIVGYENPLYFSRLFKQATGASPREYRKNC